SCPHSLRCLHCDDSGRAGRSRPRMGRSLLVALLAGAALATAAGALADITSNVSASQAIATATLAPPTNPAAAQVACKNNKPPQVNVTWTASASSFTTGYTIYRSAVDGRSM